MFTSLREGGGVKVYQGLVHKIINYGLFKCLLSACFVYI